MSTKPIYEYFLRKKPENGQIITPMSNQKKTKKSATKHTKSNKNDNVTLLQKWIYNSTVNSQPTTSEVEDIAAETKIKPVKVKSPTKNNKRQYSFAQYNVNLPSFEEMMVYKQKFEEFKKCVENFDFMDDIKPVAFIVEKPKLPDPMLDCKHLTDEQLNDSLRRNYQYLYNIYNGISVSERHTRFINQKYQTSSKSFQNLNFNTSMITFTYEQKRVLLRFLSEKFDDSDYGSNDQYFFKVLLPELCTKIFMDTHNMTYEEATNYLDNRPVE